MSSETRTLTNHQAWDGAAYIDGKPRPQDPRFTGSLADIRARYHDTLQSAYGKTVDGVLLGSGGGGPCDPPRPDRSCDPVAATSPDRPGADEF